MESVITIAEAVRRMGACVGQTFGVTFNKRSDGTERTMSCRLRVTKGVSGVGLAFNPAAKGLFGVFDLNAEGFRFVNLRGLTRLKIAGEEFKVVQ